MTAGLSHSLPAEGVGQPKPMTKQQAGATDPNLLLTLHLTPVNALVVTHTRPPANERAYGMRPYLLGAMLFCLDQVKAFALHEPEHVEKAIVARWPNLSMKSGGMATMSAAVLPLSPCTSSAARPFKHTDLRLQRPSIHTLR
ncbi:MAG: hypothetical protein FRX49_07069 [Trebouxia sp. A1-2]|nr:MAG: hypothetical protein FRX49_07069 [Trebouxia sp. A1-2]